VDLKQVNVVNVKDAKQVVVDVKQMMDVKSVVEVVRSRTRTSLQIKTSGDQCYERHDQALT